MSTAATLKAEMQSARIQARWLTGLTDQQWHNMIVGYSADWLEAFYTDQFPVEKIALLPDYTNWFIYMWQDRDVRSVLECLYSRQPTSRLYHYRTLHDLIFDPSHYYSDEMFKEFGGVVGNFLKIIKENNG